MTPLPIQARFAASSPTPGMSSDVQGCAQVQILVRARLGQFVRTLRRAVADALRGKTPQCYPDAICPGTLRGQTLLRAEALYPMKCESDESRRPSKQSKRKPVSIFRRCVRSMRKERWSRPGGQGGSTI